MMSNLTAMQELLEWTRKTLPMDLDTPRMIEEKIESLLPVEKENMRHAFDEGRFYDYDEGFEEYHEEFYGK
jgi:hypothetical protein